MRNEQIVDYLKTNCRGRTQTVRSVELEAALDRFGEEVEVPGDCG